MKICSFWQQLPLDLKMNCFPAAPSLTWNVLCELRSKVERLWESCRCFHAGIQIIIIIKHLFCTLIINLLDIECLPLLFNRIICIKRKTSRRSKKKGDDLRLADETSGDLSSMLSVCGKQRRCSCRADANSWSLMMTTFESRRTWCSNCSGKENPEICMERFLKSLRGCVKVLWCNES